MPYFEHKSQAKQLDHNIEGAAVTIMNYKLDHHITPHHTTTSKRERNDFNHTLKFEAGTPNHSDKSPTE